nr:alpha-1,4 glucan phosphorylase L-2 isozyme, chloroplastic/amyloplastic-like [Tanacetum cinerariifolium]
MCFGGNKSKVFSSSMCFGGKAFATYVQSKTIVKFIIDVDATITMILILVVVVPDCYVTVAEVLFLGSDLPQHISTAGMEASEMSNMKFVMSGCIQIATLDGEIRGQGTQPTLNGKVSIAHNSPQKESWRLEIGGITWSRGFAGSRKHIVLCMHGFTKFRSLDGPILLAKSAIRRLMSWPAKVHHHQTVERLFFTMKIVSPRVQGNHAHN